MFRLNFVSVKNRRAQIWVETVIYTLIGLALIGVVLAIVTPKINESKDKIIVEQSISSLNLFDQKISSVIDTGVGNRRTIGEFLLKKGTLTVNGENDEIYLMLKDISKYSEPGAKIKIGNVLIESVTSGKKVIVYLTLNYSGIVNLTFNGADVIKKFDPANIPYSFTVDNKESGRGNLFVIDVQETSGRGNTQTPACIPSSESCSDNEDNDCDGLTDCGDSDCDLEAACQQPFECPEGHSSSGDNTCTVEITDVVEDGEIVSIGGTYSRTTTGEIRVSRKTNGLTILGYVEWNLNSIPDNSQIEEVIFKYYGVAFTTDGSYRQQQIISIENNLRPSTTSNNQQLYSAMTNVGYSTYHPAESTFILNGLQGPFSLSNEAINRLQSNLDSDQKWFAVGLTPFGTYNLDPNIKSSESDTKPTLIVKYRLGT